MCPFDKLIIGILKIAAMGFEHMILIDNGLNMQFFEALVRSNTAAFVKHFYNIFGDPDVNLFAYKAEKNRIFVEPIGYKIVISDCTYFPDGRLVRMSWQRLHKLLLFLQISISATADWC